MRLLRSLDRLTGLTIAAAQWLALPLVLLLFLQWPLRDLVRAYSREANDLAQVIFALFVAASVTAATRAGTHLAADTLAQRYAPRTRLWIARIGSAVGLVPWALFVLLGGKNIVIASIEELEAFPDTNNPGYFVIKIALWVMALLVLGQAVIDIARPPVRDEV